MREPTITLYNADCLPAMREMEDNQFELAIVDPPYGLGDFINSADGKGGIRKTNWDIDWNNNIPCTEYFNELYRISINQIIWGCNYYKGHIRDVGRIIFDKSDGGKAGLNFSDCDLASNSKHRNIKVWRYKWMGIMGLQKEPNRIHPCQKPVALYKWLLKNYATPGDTILDTHLGSGSIAIACHDYGFDLVGYELDPDYYAAAVKRLDDHRAQMRLNL